MDKLSLTEVAQVTNAEKNSDAEIFFDSILTDTRKIKGGELFIALKGENSNGESFTRTASANNTSNFFLFNTATNGTYPFLGRLYGDVVCVKSGIEVFRGVPCTNPNREAGLYDLIGNSFKGSSNSATFTAGPAIN